MNKKKILILGSNGLVGSSLVRILKQQNQYELIASTRSDADLFKLEDVKKLINRTKPDLIINAAAKVGGILYNNTHRVDFLMDNLKINMNILEAIIPSSEIQLINLGSSCIYPLDAANPISENSFMDGKLEPTNSPYAIAKIVAIELGNNISDQYGHNVVNLMPTNLYGPNDFFDNDKSHVIPALLKKFHDAKINKSKDVVIWGTGKPLREFLYVDDLSEFIQSIIFKKLDHRLINVGSNEEVSINELAYIIKKITGFDGNLNFDKSKPDGNPRKLLDSSLAFNTGWSPKVTLEEGIEETYNWFLHSRK